MGSRLSESELQVALDFCVKLFNPTCSEERARAIQNELPEALLDINAPVNDPIALQNNWVPQAAKNSEEVRAVVEKVNARRVLHREYGINNMEAEAIDGLAVRLGVGNLGLKRL